MTAINAGSLKRAQKKAEAFIVWTRFKGKRRGLKALGRQVGGMAACFGEKSRHVAVTEYYTHQVLRSEAVKAE